MPRSPAIWRTSGAIALLVTSAAGLAWAGEAPDTPGNVVSPGGHGVYVEVTGPEGASPLLYLHGGPGMGSYDFGLAQSEELSRHLRLILMDQRGALRSDALDGEAPFGLGDLLADIEALRDHLGFERWSVLGHSFGGYLGVRYALEHPTSVGSLILENPTLDMASSARSVLRGAAAEYRRMGQPDDAARCLEAADAKMTPQEAWEAFSGLTRGLGASRNNLYVHGPEKDFFDQLIAQSGIPGESWARHQLFQKKLHAEGDVFRSLLPRLGDLDVPVMLIRGRHDFVVAQEQVDALREALPGAKVVVFEHSSHFPHHEEADLFAETVLGFLAARAAPAPTGR